MKRLILGLILAAGWMLADTDVTGKWTGTLDMKQDGDAQTITVVMNVKQEGTKLTGTAGTDEEQHPIQNGVIDGDKITMEVDNGEAVYRLQLVVNGDEISGEVKHGDDAPAMKIVMKRVKES